MKNQKNILKIFNKLVKFDRPSICNALELIDPKCQ